MRKFGILGVVLIAAMTFGGGVWVPAHVDASGQEQSASLSGEVGAGQRHVTRLRNLPRGANLAVEVTTDGRLRVLVLDEAQHDSLPGPVRPLITGSGETRISFELVIPTGGTYFLVVDNSEASEPRTFTLNLQAKVGEAREGAGAADGQDRALQELERFQSNLRQTFIFDEFEFRIAQCGEPGGANGGRTVTLCTEVGPLALQRLGDAAKARDVVLFVMLREVGRALLQQWGLPTADSEDVVDQFAVVLYLMYDQGARLDAVAEFLDAFESGAESASGLTDVRPQRLENLKRWRADPDLVRQWQPFLARHIQTNTLRVLANHPRDWTDVEAVNEELSRR